MPKNIPVVPLTSFAFGQLYEKHKANLVTVARSYVRETTVAEDIVTDCFLYYWENREKIEIKHGVPAYILTSVKNRCLNWLRDERNRLKLQERIHSNSMRVISERIASLQTDNPDSTYLKDMVSIIERELNKMPSSMRKVFLASRLDDMTYKEIADKFSMSENQVEFEIRKAIKIFQIALRDYLGVFCLFFLDL